MQLDPDASLATALSSKKSPKLGLFSYPVLQAADILVHRATHVPVGEDQKQHLEFARECVTNFNTAYKTNVLVPPKTTVSLAKRIMSLTNPLQKMSKSDPSPKSRILITDTPDIIKTRIKTALTDSVSGVTYDQADRPGLANLVDILTSFDPKNRTSAQLAEKMKGYGIADLKQVVAQVLCDQLAEIRDAYQTVRPKHGELQAFADVGAEKARQNAAETMRMVYDAMGFGPLR